MITAIAYCHKDIYETLRLLRWIAFLGDGHVAGKILLVPSRHASMRRAHYQIAELAAKTFETAYCYVPEGEVERGWPESCNWQFKQALLHVEQHFQDDMLWIEPDAVPLIPQWLYRIEREWGRAVNFGKTFMGMYVTKSEPHMSGVAVYGRNWRMIAPSLIEATRTIPWDIYSAPQVLPVAYLNSLIMHWREPDVARINIQEMLKNDVVLFHQDKRGILLHELDKQLYGGAATERGLFRDTKEPTLLMRKYYHTDNASKRIEANGQFFYFEPYDNFGGAWRGTYTTEDEGEQIILATATGNPASGVTEISEQEYTAKNKKKPRTLSSTPSAEWKPPPVNIRQSPATLVVENPLPSPEQEIEAKPLLNVENIESVIKLDKVQPAQTEDIKIPRKRTGKKAA